MGWPVSGLSDGMRSVSLGCPVLGVSRADVDTGKHAFSSCWHETARDAWRFNQGICVWSVTTARGLSGLVYDNSEA